MPLKELKVVEAKGKTKQELVNELQEEGFNAYEWSDASGAYYPPHSHEHDECICVVSGKMSFYINGKEYELSSGKKLYLPKATLHEAKNRWKDTVTYLIGELH